MPDGLSLRQWGRYEIENYLLFPELLKRFVRADPETPLFAAPSVEVIDQEFAANFPVGIDFLQDIPTIRSLKASEFLVELLNRTQVPLPKRDLFMLAKLMQPGEIHPDVLATLDAIADMVPGIVPAVDANLAPVDVNGVEEEPPRAPE